MMFDDFETGRRRNEIQKGGLWERTRDSFRWVYGGPCLFLKARLGGGGCLRSTCRTRGWMGRCVRDAQIQVLRAHQDSRFPSLLEMMIIPYCSS